MRFEFATANRIIFGPGTLAEAGDLAAALGQRALVVTGRRADRARGLIDSLQASGVECSSFAIAGEPTTEDVRRGVELARQEGCDLLIGMGGGSPLDAAKAIAALLSNGGDPLDYLEVIGQGRPLAKPSAPCIAIPTTAGTGTEVTRNAVIASPEHRVKVSLRALTVLPTLALVDPQLTYSLPPQVTARTGLDALTQIIEPFVSARANPITDGLCREGLRRIAGALRRAYRQPDDARAREDMCLASLFGGLALANAGLGAVHGFAGPIGGMFQGPHGAVCAALLPRVMAANVNAFRHRQPDSPSLTRYDEVAALLTDNPHAPAEDGVAWVRDLCADLRVPGLSAYGMTRADLPEVIEKSAIASSMKANPIPITRDEMQAILEGAL